MKPKKILTLIEIIFSIIALAAVIFKVWLAVILIMLIILAIKIYYLYKGFNKEKGNKKELTVGEWAVILAIAAVAIILLAILLR